MLSTYLFLFTFCVLSILWLRRVTKDNKRLPPGPVGIPLLGYLPFMDVFHLGDSFAKIGRKFGNIFSLRVGTELAVVLDDYDTIVKAFSQPELCARPDTFMFRFFSRGEHGIASSSGERWRVQRKFTHKHLKKLGKGHDGIEKHLEEETMQLVNNFENASKEGKSPVEVGYDVNMSVANVTWALVSGERKEHNDSRMMRFLQSVNEAIELASTSGILLFMPFLIKVLPEKIFGLDRMRKWMDESYSFINDTIKEHISTRIEDDTNNNDRCEDRDFIDAFLTEMENPNAHESFNNFQLQVLCSELFGAGGEPTSVTLKWALRFLAMNQEVQSKARKEIHDLVGSGRNVQLSDKENLPYVQALVMDLIRLSDIHPIGVLHAPERDTEIEGYTIPKGTFIFPNFHKVHRDPQYWDKPEELYPQHWLDEAGNFIPKREGFLSFGVGKRNCPGQDFAKSILFSFIANLIQKFNFQLTPEDTGKIECTTGCVVSPKPYSLLITPNK